MPDAVVVAIAKEVTAMLAAAELSQSFTPERSYADWEIVLDEECPLRVDVMAHSAELKAEPSARNKLKHDVPVLIAVRRKFGVNTQDDDTGRIEIEEIDALLLLVQEIHELFTMGRMAEFQSGTWTSTMLMAAPHQDHLYRQRQFTGLIKLTFRQDRNLT